ncbi:MAG TPA: AAA family ATPase [Methylomirabilota bacterium]|jgi:tetratricopeptide (TPR) repeat protein|nr:AAA family ATPase [Methylomirabilota bacterium]
MTASSRNPMAPGASSSIPAPDTAAADQSPAGFPPARAFFVGRERELHELGSAVEAMCAGSGRLLLLVGEPGIGKTRLADELAAIARQSGVNVLWGRCWEGDGAPAFWPWRQLLRAYAQQCAPDILASEMGSGGPIIAQVVAEVRERLPHLPASPELSPEAARFHFFDSITLWLKKAAARQPLLLILDDLHWADTPSLLLLQFLARELHETRLLVLGAYRDTEVNEAHPLAEALGVLARESQRIQLSGLSPDEVLRFLEHTTGATPSPGLVTSIRNNTEGNPFFVQETVRLLAAEGSLTSRERYDALGGNVPPSVKETIRRRLLRLSPACVHMLTIAATIGHEFSSDLLARVCQNRSGTTWELLLSSLQEAIAARILAKVGGEEERYRFLHALIRETLYEDAPLQERVQLHRHVGEAIETLYGAYLRPHLTELAEHFFKARQSDVGDKALHYAIQAGERAAALLAYEEAASYYARALQLLPLTEANEKQRCELLLARGEVLSYAGETQQSRETFFQAAAIARKLRTQDNTTQIVSFLARAALGLGTVWFVTGTGMVDEPLVRLLAEARDALGETDSPLYARVLARLAAELRWSAPPEQRTVLSQQAIAMARRLGDESTLVYTLSAWHWALWSADNVEERLTVASEMIHVAEKGKNDTLALVGRTWRSLAWLELGKREQSDADIEIAFALAEKLRQPFYRWWATGQRTLRALLEGRLEEAERCIYQQLRLGQQVQAPDTLQAFGVQMAILRNEQDRLQEMEAVFKEFAGQYPTVPAWRCGLAGLYRELEQEDQARAEFERIAAHNFTDLPQDQQWLTALMLLSDVCTFLRETDHAVRLYELLLPFANRVAIIGPGAACYGAVDRSLGLLAAVLSLWDKASRHFEDALIYNARIRATPFLVRTQYEYAQMLIARGSPQGQERARRLLDNALTTAQELGLKRLQSKLEILKSEESQKSTVKGQQSKIEPLQLPSFKPQVLRSQDSALSTQNSNVFHLEGEYWTLSYADATVRLHDVKGLHHIATLLREPGREFHVIDLLAETDRDPTTTRAQRLDEDASVSTLALSAARPDYQARTRYRERLAELRAELAQVDQFNDLGGSAAIRAEMEFLTQELSAAYNARKSNGEIEKARKAVAYRIRTALGKLRQAHPRLWRHLSLSLKTGVFCSYTPEKPTTWLI